MLYGRLDQREYGDSMKFKPLNHNLIWGLMYSNPVYIEVSGGKDSTLALLYVYDKINQLSQYNNNLHILYIETPLSHILNTLYIYYLGDKLGIPVIKLRNNYVFGKDLEYYKKLARTRKCMIEFKYKPLNNFVRRHRGIYVLGVRRYESKRRLRYKYKLIYDVKNKIYIYYPILYVDNNKRDKLLDYYLRKYKLGKNPCWFFKYNVKRSSGDCYPCLLTWRDKYENML